MTLFDTDTFTLFTQNHAKVVSRASQHAASVEAIQLPLPVRLEALRGRFDFIFKVADSIELLRVAFFLRETEISLGRFEIIDFDQAAAAKFDELRQIKGLKAIRRGDILIASIALASDALLVSRNLKDFRQVPGLRVENWAD